MSSDPSPSPPVLPAERPTEPRRVSVWVRLRPLAFLAPLAVNWPGGTTPL